ncbi:hypothetical protein N9B72_02025 [Bacteriovoracaceae bacterium]|nr:hypothetical protein [Bacteriovoracaceae bacterium]
MIEYRLLFTFSTMICPQAVDLNKSFIQSYLARTEKAGAPSIACHINAPEILKKIVEYECDSNIDENEINLNEIYSTEYTLWSSPLKLSAITFSGNQINANNLLVKDSDDTGMTPSSDIGANRSFVNTMNSKLMFTFK